MVELVIGSIAAAGGFKKASDFVRKKLRFVSAVQKPGIPFVAGAGAALLAAPVVAILPILGAGTAIAVGVGVGLGVAHGNSKNTQS